MKREVDQLGSFNSLLLLAVPEAVFPLENAVNG
jgi:hypothetical protein